MQNVRDDTSVRKGVSPLFEVARKNRQGVRFLENPDGEQIYFDELAQSFASDGNLFLNLTSVSGNVNQAGEDLRDLVATLVIPINRFQAVAKNVQLAASIYPGVVQSGVEAVSPTSPRPVEHAAPLFIPD